MMKKIFSHMLLCAAVIFASCGNDDDETPPIAVSGVALDKTTLSIMVNETGTLTAMVAPENAADKSVTWSSDKTDIATVKDGIVAAVAAGTATITATSVADKAKKATCVVTVEALNYVEMNGIKVAVGNLVADGANGAKIGTATDGGLYFLFGSLIGWAGGATGDGTGVPASNSPGYAFNATGTVVPSGKTIPTTWGDPDKWTGTTCIVPSGYDPCTQYLGLVWRLPTKGEYETLFGITDNDSWTNGWSWTDSPASATHTNGSTFPASGSRGSSSGGNLKNVGMVGAYWSASANTSSLGYYLALSSSEGGPIHNLYRENGVSVRCVQNASN